MRVYSKIAANLFKYILFGLTATFHLGCSMTSTIEDLSVEPQSIRVIENPGANAGNFSSYSLSGVCPKGLESFQISTPVNQIITCTSDRTWVLTLDLSAQPDGAIDVVTDQIDSATGAPIQFRIHKDIVPPNVQMYSTASSPNNLVSIPVTVAFDEPVVGLASTDFAVTNGTVSLVVGAGADYIAYVIPTSSGMVSVSLGAGVARDLVGNLNLAPPMTVDIVYDGDRPSVLLGSLEANPTNNSSISVDVVFSENVSGLVPGDFTVSGAVPLVLNGSGSVYELVLSATVSGVIQVQLPANRAEDVAANGNLASNVFSITYDNHNPLPTLSSVVASPTNASVIPVVVNFDRAVTGFSADDLVVSNATVSDFTGNGNQYTFNLNPQGEGLVEVEVPANVSQSAVGLANVASDSFSMLVDTTPGTLLVSSPTPAIGNVSHSFQWSLTYSDYHVITLTTSDISLSYTGTVSCANKAISGGGAIKSVNVSNCTGEGTVEIDIAAGTAADEAGNDFAAHTTSDAATVTNTPPDIAFTGPVPATGDETTEFVWTVTYSNENSISLSLGDITVNGDTEGCTTSLFSTGTHTREIHVQGCKSAGGISISLAAGTALGYGGSALTTDPSAAAILTNRVLATMAQISSLVDKNPTGTSSQSFLVSLDKPFYRDVTVSYELMSLKSTAVSPTNHNLQKGSVTIPAGQTNASIDYTYQDGATTGSKIVQLALTGTSEKVVGIKEQVSRRMMRDSVAQDASYADFSLGHDFTCVVKVNGDLYCLGSNNSHGQVGNNTLASTPQLQLVGSGFLKVSSGSSHNCAIKSDGSLWCWGYNTYGQVGDGTNTDKLVPTFVGNDFAQVSVGWDYTCAVNNDGDLYCWGENTSGQFGNNTTTSSNVPVLIGSGYASVDAGINHTCAITTGKELRCWGGNSKGQIGNNSTNSSFVPVTIGSDYESVSASGEYTCAIKDGDDLYCFGVNFYGNLGTGDTTDRLVPVLIGSGYVAVSAFKEYTCALKSNGDVQCWGMNSLGQLGDGTKETRTSPVTIGGGYYKIVTGLYHACAAKVGGGLDCWGRDMAVEPLISQRLPSPVGSGYLQVVEGGNHACGVKTDNKLFCWGSNSAGQIGVNSGANMSAPVYVGSGYARVGVGNAHSCGITVGGDLYCWGENANGQLGNGTLVRSASPLFVGHGYAKVKAGTSHTCAIKNNGDLFCWGSNSSGQIGDGTTVIKAFPTFIGAGYSEISLGFNNTCAVKINKDLQCWGNNANGRLGNNSTDNSSVPVLVGSNYVSVVTRQVHTCGLKADGELLCWGSNSFGQFGNATTTGSLVPLSVGGNYLKVTAGSQHTCGIKVGGDLMCWGNNASGQLGYGSFVATSQIPVLVGTGYAEVQAQGGATTALKLNGDLQSWGAVVFGRLGDGSLLNTLSPVVVRPPAP